MRKRRPALADLTEEYLEEEKKLREDARYIHCQWSGYLSYPEMAVDTYHRAHLYADTIGFEQALWILRSCSERITYATDAYTEEYANIMYGKLKRGESVTLL